MLTGSKVSYDSDSAALQEAESDAGNFATD